MKKKLVMLLLCMLCTVAFCMPAYARTSYDTLKDEDNNVTYSISYEDYLYDGTGNYFMASISKKENITARKGLSPSGKVTFLLRCRAKDDRWVYADLTWGGPDTDCTKRYTASYNSTYDKVSVPVTITREATSGHTWGSTWTMVSGSTTQHERQCTHPVCVQTDICEAAWSGCTSNGDGTHTFMCTEGHEVTVPCSGGTATCVASATCKDCGGPYGSVNPDNHKEKTAATCVDKATCELCGEEYGSVNPDNHLPGTKATCTSDQVCNRVGCGKVLTKRLGHDESGDEATCTTDKVCNRVGCGAVLVNRLGHDESGDEATCTTDKVCARKGCDFVLAERLGHDESGAEPTCTTDKVCNRVGCDAVLVEALGHDESGADATCTTDKVCNREGCDYVLVYALGHDESGVEPTCTTDKVCARKGCDFVLAERLGHDESGAEPTCTTDKVCAREGCDFVLAERLGHDESGANATCTIDKVCARKGCDAVLVKALGHRYALWASNEDGTHSADCKRKNCKHTSKQDCAAWEVTETKDEIATTLKVCPVCGEFGKASFAVIAGAKIVCEKLPMGEAIGSGLKAPFEGVLYAFTAGYEYGGKMQEFKNVKDEEILPITITLPLDETIGEFTLVRVDVTPATDEAERTEVWTEIAYTFENGVLSFETEADGLFLLLPVVTEEA